MAGFLDSITGSMAKDPLAWTKFGLGATGAIGSGIEAYMAFKEKQKQAALQEEMMRNEDRRAELGQQQQFKAYDEAAGQRSANTMATMAPVISQAETLRDRLRMLRGAA